MPNKTERALRVAVAGDSARLLDCLGANAKPRDGFAGPHRFATFRGLISSRHRDVCRPVVTGFGVALSKVSSIGLPSIHDVTPRLALPRRGHVARLASRLRSSASVFLFRDNPQTSCRGWSPPVGLRRTRNSERAQQRNIDAATGSSVVKFEHPSRPESP